MLPAFRSGKINTFALPASLLSGNLRAAISGTKAVSTWSSPSKSASSLRLQRFLFGEGGGGLDLAHRGMRRAAFGGEGKQGDARADAEQMPRQLGGGHSDIRKLLDGRALR